MQSKNKDSMTLKKEASELRDAARSRLDQHLETLRGAVGNENHSALEGEIEEVVQRHKVNGESLKGPDGLAAHAKQNTKHFARLGNQKNILRFLKLRAAHDKLEERLKKEAADAAIAMAAKRVYDLLGR